VEEVGAAVEAASRPGEAEAANASAAIAVEGATAGSFGLALTQLEGREDAPEEFGCDTESVIFSEVGDSRASSHAADSEAEGAAVADSTPARPRVQRQTSPVYRTQLTTDKLSFWKRSTAIEGELTGNIGLMFSNWENASNKL
jgi:hypothetical protein